MDISNEVVVKKYFLEPTALIPNSPQPLLHYPQLLKDKCNPAKIHQQFDENDWRTQWVFRYGPTQESHYHSRIHECMVVLSGKATIRFGVADTSDDLEESTYRGACEQGGVTIDAQAGDVFVIPAGVAHKTHNTSPGAAFALLTPGKGRGIEATNQKGALEKVNLSGFTMMGAYPKNCGTWDFSVGGEDVGDFEATWSVPKPEKDPLLGAAEQGIRGQWKNVALSKRQDKRAKL
ncbi:hypothetical protein LTR70_001000 [Exophiala xenobiotica]|uniref:Cupin type-1 domain-containing protein n=1 Tax=Lithohypha guttulata TaxID=1690604 RepID=A0ABR0KN14_9EURO|nr:hypothetical protein LTR24_000810 [Lithohypha guttulata]KAK5328846.1 hypothetical protein LTR70_001000 [Exophiala xenobiotica]